MPSDKVRPILDEERLWRETDELCKRELAQMKRVLTPTQLRTMASTIESDCTEDSDPLRRVEQLAKGVWLRREAFRRERAFDDVIERYLQSLAIRVIKPPLELTGPGPWTLVRPDGSTTVLGDAPAPDEREWLRAPK